MGAGKTHIGRRLARRFGMPFTDADEEIERSAGLSVEQIFQQLGEPAFREGERRVIARLLDSGPVVLATGGGAFIDPDTRARIREKALSVWLRADLSILLLRTGGRSGRPLLAKGDPSATLSDLMAIRYPIYAEADVVVDTDDEPPDVTTDRVVAAIRNHGEMLSGAAR